RPDSLAGVSQPGESQRRSGRSRGRHRRHADQLDPGGWSVGGLRPDPRRCRPDDHPTGGGRAGDRSSAVGGGGPRRQPGALGPHLGHRHRAARQVILLECRMQNAECRTVSTFCILNSPMLEVSNLSFAYNAGRPDAIVALREVNLCIAPGELVAVIGHNGSGKSTLAKLLCAILTPTEGEITVDGIPATPANAWEIRRRVGMVFQRPDDQLVANTVIDDVAFGPENLGLPRDEIERRVRESLAALGMGGMARTQISELS